MEHICGQRRRMVNRFQGSTQYMKRLKPVEGGMVDYRPVLLNNSKNTTFRGSVPDLYILWKPWAQTCNKADWLYALELGLNYQNSGEDCALMNARRPVVVSSSIASKENQGCEILPENTFGHKPAENYKTMIDYFISDPRNSERFWIDIFGLKVCDDKCNRRKGK